MNTYEIIAHHLHSSCQDTDKCTVRYSDPHTYLAVTIVERTVLFDFVYYIDGNFIDS
jgi:hypothetical protein